jgi:hypothetical protein
MPVSRETKINAINGALGVALAGRKHVFGYYMLSSSDVMKIVSIIIKVLATLGTPECSQCTSELLGDIFGGHGSTSEPGK